MRAVARLLLHSFVEGSFAAFAPCFVHQRWAIDIVFE